MKVKAIIERDDGGADVVIEELTPYELSVLVEQGFITLIERYIDEQEKRKKIPAILKGDKA
jgi:hypothetical protein